MRVALIGATGVLGRRTGPCLVEAGHEVTALVRTASGQAAVRGWGARPVHGDLLEPDTLGSALRGAEAVVNLASAIPTVPSPSPGDWASNDRVRREGTRNLLAAIRHAGVGHYLHTSVYLVYGDDVGDDPVDESARLGPAPPIRSAVDGEEAVRATDGLGWTILRPGWLYDGSAWHTARLLDALRAGEAVVLDDAPAWRSPVHATDFARAVALLLGRPPAGETFNVADERPVPAGELLDGIAELLDAPRPPRLSEAEALERLGPAATAALRRSVRLRTDRLRRLGFEPRYRSWRAGFAAVVNGVD